MLELRRVKKLYSSIPVVNDISFAVPAGEITGCLGANGSGKSTTMKMIAGLIEPSEGEILLDGESINRDRIRHRQRYGYVPEEPQLYSHLTGTEYLEMVGQLRGLPQDRIAEKIDGFLHLSGLYENRDVAISSYSKGMRQKVLLAGALLHNPDLLLFDEPFSGLDVNAALILRDLLRSLADHGKAVLLSSHELDIIERVCSRVIILNRGRVVASNAIAQLRSLMALPTLEEIFSQLAVEQDTEAISRQLMQLVES